MNVVWAWVFLDLPEDGFDGQLAFWQAVTSSSLSTWRGDHDEFVTLLPPEGDPWVKVQRVAGRGGVHLDLEVVDVLAATEEAVAEGARVVRDLGSLVVCASPGGLAFCLVEAPEGAPRRQVRDGQSLLDQVCLDIPSATYPAELDFWTRLTGWAPPGTPSAATSGPGPGPSGLLPLTRPEGLPMRLLTQRLGEQNGLVAAHVDLACRDRGRDTVEHVGLGAEVESVGERWTVLRAPGGVRYCLTDRDPRTGLLA